MVIINSFIHYRGHAHVHHTLVLQIWHAACGCVAVQYRRICRSFAWNGIRLERCAGYGHAATGADLYGHHNDLRERGRYRFAVQPDRLEPEPCVAIPDCRWHLQHFQIVGGTCNTTTQYVAPATCTVQIRFIGNQPGTATADLQMGCSAIVAAVGGYGISCNLGGGPGAVDTMAHLVGNGIAAVVDTLGREGLTLLAAALFALAAWVSVRRPRLRTTSR